MIVQSPRAVRQAAIQITNRPSGQDLDRTYEYLLTLAHQVLYCIASTLQDVCLLTAFAQNYSGGLGYA